MKLRALELEQFRKFDRPVRIAGLADGLNLVVGPNEMGKSTLFAALQAVLFERHRSQAQAVKSLQPAGHEGAAPRVALDFEIGPGHYRIEKRFLRRPSADLLLPDGRHLHGEPAEEALAELLAGAFAEDGGDARRGSADADGVWSLLWVGQGQSIVLPEPAPGARGTLQAALDAELGEILAGDHGTALIASLDQALQDLVYKAGRPRGRYREAEDARQRLEIEIAELEGRREELERDLNELDAARADHERLSAEQSAGREATALAELAMRCDQLKLRQAELREAEAELKAERAGLEATAAELARREALVAELAKSDAERAEAATALDAATAAAEAAETLASECTIKVERLRTTLEQEQSRGRGLHRLVQAIRQRDVGRAALQAAASEVAFEIEPAMLERVRVDGRPLAEPGCSLRIVDPLTIAITGIGRIAVRPMVSGHRRLRSSLREAERQIERELEVLGFRPANPKAHQLEFQLAAAGLGGLPSGPAPEAPTPAWPESAAVESALGEAERRIAALAAELGVAQRELDTAASDRHRTAALRALAEARSAQAERRAEQLRAEHGTAERRADTAGLETRKTELQGRVAMTGLRLRQLQEQTGDTSLDELEKRMAGLRATVDQRAAALRERDLTLERLRERIQVVAGGGLDERLAGARRRCDELARECAKYRREVETLELLLRLLRDAEREAKERYVGPVVRRLRPYVEAMFPGADLVVDDALRITAVARSGQPEPLERLSEGTREQIAILARLAFAELLADQGRPSMVVLDDALVFSDDQRIERMFEILTRAGAKLQILVLTCRERVFRGLEAHRLHLETVAAAGVR